MTTEQLLEKAKAETGVFTAYGTSSRIADAMISFIDKYGKDLGIDNDTSKGVKKNDSDAYTLLAAEYASKQNKGASMVMVQDGAQLILYREESEMLKTTFLPLLKEYPTASLFLWFTNTSTNCLFGTKPAAAPTSKLPTFGK